MWLQDMIPEAPVNASHSAPVCEVPTCKGSSRGSGNQGHLAELDWHNSGHGVVSHLAALTSGLKKFGGRFGHPEVLAALWLKLGVA